MKKKYVLCSAIVIMIVCIFCISINKNTEENACPNIIPSIMEWEAGKGMFTVQRGNIVISQKDLEAVEPIAKQLQKEYKEITGVELSIKTGNKVFLHKGDIYLGFSAKRELQREESYLCKIKNHILIESQNAEGLLWGTRTLLQMLVQNPQEIVQGNIYDFPKYIVRGIGIDVARHPMSIDSLKMLIQVMAYYKMNDLHLHLNDNELLCYSDKVESIEQSLKENYSAFRLESEITNGKGEKITSEDYFYSTEKFAELISYASEWGVNIVPEIDTPAHSLAITKHFPELFTHHDPRNVDSLNIKDERTVKLVHDIWSDALRKAFADCEVVHVGMDEAFFGGNDYANFANSVMGLCQMNEKKVRIWGSMSRLGCTESLLKENVQVNIWNTFWTNPQEVYEAGFDMINTISEHLYIIPAGGYDYLDNEYIYTMFEPNKFVIEENIYEVPDSEQMLGASMFVWNDFCGTIDMGISEYDIIDRIIRTLPYFSQKVWGTSNSLGYEAFTENIRDIKNVPGSRLYQPPDVSQRIYPPYDVKFQIMTDEKQTVLFEEKTEYGRDALVINEEGYLEYLMEFRKYTFNYIPKQNDEIMLLADMGTTSLWVNGMLVEQIGTNNPFQLHGTFVFPITANEHAINMDSFSYVKK